MGEMFHTTPNNEGEEERYRREHPGSNAESPVKMFESHGSASTWFHRSLSG